MTQIIKSDHFDFSEYSGLTVLEQKMINCSASAPVLNPELEDFGKKELVKALIISINESVLLLGQKELKPEDTVTISMQVAGHIFDNYERIKYDELKTAIKRGSFGEYAKEKEVVFMSAKNIINWIKCYMTEKQKTMFKFQEQNRRKLEEVRRQEEDKRKSAEFINNLPTIIENQRQSYLENGFTDWIAWLYYDRLEEMELIVITPDKKKKIYKEALAISKQETRKEKGFDFKFVQNSSLETNAVNIAKRICLEQWFDEKNGDISSLIQRNLHKIQK